MKLFASDFIVYCSYLPKDCNPSISFLLFLTPLTKMFCGLDINIVVVNMMSVNCVVLGTSVSVSFVLSLY